MTDQPLNPIEQHHYDTITERMGLNRLKAEERAARGEDPLDPADLAPADPEPQQPTIRDSVTRLAVLGAVLAEVKSAYAEARTEVEHYLNAQHAETGTSKLDALLPDGTKAGSVSRAGGEVAAQVVDADALTAWVRDHVPSEHEVEIVPMQIITRVRPSFLAKLLAEATAAGVAQYADPESGVIHDLPGVDIRPSRAASVRMTYSRRSKSQASDGKELIAAAWRSGGLAAHVLPALASDTTDTPSDTSDIATDAA